MKKIVFFFLFCISFDGFSQNFIEGRVISYKDNLNDEIIISNITSKKKKISGENGFFNIEASLNDTISFFSPSCIEKKIVVDNNSLRDFIIVELSDKVDTLSEVIIYGSKNKLTKYDLEKLNSNLKEQVRYDMVNNPEKYIKQKTFYGGVDLFALPNLIFKRNKKKRRVKSQERKKLLTFEDLKNILEQENIISKQFIIEDLRIKENQINSFLFFVADKRIFVNKDLKDLNYFLLFDKMIGLSEEYKNSGL